jgi:hypothetical protein
LTLPPAPPSEALRRAKSDGDGDEGYGYFDDEGVDMYLGAGALTSALTPREGAGAAEPFSPQPRLSEDQPLAGHYDDTLVNGERVLMADLDVIGTIGAGESALVKVVQHTPTGRQMALKVRRTSEKTPARLPLAALNDLALTPHLFCSSPLRS